MGPRMNDMAHRGWSSTVPSAECALRVMNQRGASRCNPLKAPSNTGEQRAFLTVLLIANTDNVVEERSRLEEVEDGWLRTRGRERDADRGERVHHERVYLVRLESGAAAFEAAPPRSLRRSASAMRLRAAL